MSIPFNRYIDITSSVGASNVIPERQYIAKLFTDNPLLPPFSFIEFNALADVGDFFGFLSNEYLRAQFYFSFINKNGTAPLSIAYDRWVDVAVKPMIAGAQLAATYNIFGTWQLITNGSFGITITNDAGTNYVNITGLDFHLDASMSAVAGTIQTAIRAAVSMNAQWNDATVTFNAAGTGSFVFLGGVAENATISLQPGVGGTDISHLMGWLPEATFTQGVYSPGSVVSAGSVAEDIAAHLTLSTSVSNNFGSFAFITSTPLTLAQNIEAAQWNAAQNVMFIFSIPVIASNVADWSADVGGLGLIAGTALTVNVNAINLSCVLNSTAILTGMLNVAGLAPGMQVTGTGVPPATTILGIVNNYPTDPYSITLSNAVTTSATETLVFYPLQFPEMLPMAIQASTNYNAVNTVQNYEFQIASGLIPTVFDNTTANNYDNASVNYYGQTQTAGQLLSFYQTGVLLGLPSNPLGMNVYANEIWLRDAMGAAIMTAFLNLNQIAANQSGILQLTAIIQSVISQALLNGTISVGKPLDIIQQLYITQVTGDPKAWYQVQNVGYWLNVAIVQIPNVSPIRYEAVYTLVYSKDDVINKVVGTHILI